VRFLVDRCAGIRLARWLRDQGHDVVESRDHGDDPGDLKLLRWAVEEHRILVTLDTDFGQLVYTQATPHCGLIRLPDVPAERRIAILGDLLTRHTRDLEKQAIITVRAGRVRVGYFPKHD
jgi:predicted nuclease of predicted toxin-antitoxin system